MIDALQRRVNEQMQENGRLLRDNQALVEDTTRARTEATDKARQVQDLKSRLKEQDHQLSMMHQRALEQAQLYLSKQDDV